MIERFIYITLTFPVSTTNIENTFFLSTSPRSPGKIPKLLGRTS